HVTEYEEKVRSVWSMMGHRLSGEALEFLADLRFHLAHTPARFRPLRNHDFDSSVFIPAFFVVIGRERFGLSGGHGFGQVGLDSSVDQHLNGVFSPCSGEFDVIPNALPRIVSDRCVVGMTSNLYALVTEPVQDGSDPLEQGGASESDRGVTCGEELPD